MENKISEAIKQFDKFYKIPIFLGTLILISAGFQNNIIMIKFGILTFIFGLIFWPSASLLDIKANFHIPPDSKDTPKKSLKRMLCWYVPLLIVETGIYIFLVARLFV